jgi:hypothetical protein
VWYLLLLWLVLPLLPYYFPCLHYLQRLQMAPLLYHFLFQHLLSSQCRLLGSSLAPTAAAEEQAPPAVSQQACGGAG